jgi:hypothetical protein
MDDKKLSLIGVLTHESGWMGGQWRVNGKAVNKASLPKQFVLKFRDKYFKAKVVKTQGEDNDMGHVYSWNSIDFEFKVSSDVGPLTLLLLRDFPKRGLVKLYQEA